MWTIQELTVRKTLFPGHKRVKIMIKDYCGPNFLGPVLKNFDYCNGLFFWSKALPYVWKIVTWIKTKFFRGKCSNYWYSRNPIFSCFQACSGSKNSRIWVKNDVLQMNFDYQWAHSKKEKNIHFKKPQKWWKLPKLGVIPDTCPVVSSGGLVRPKTGFGLFLELD